MTTATQRQRNGSATTTMAEQLDPDFQKLMKMSPIREIAERYSVAPNSVMRILRNTVIKPQKRGDQWKEATDEEVAAFLIVANEYDLNPFTKEIYAFLSKGGGVVPVVGVDGWIKIINRQVALNGISFEERDDDGGKLQAVTCTIHIKERDYPVVVKEWLSECGRNTDQWRDMPRRMLRHKALIQCARVAFGLSGIYDEDEARDIAANTIGGENAATVTKGVEGLRAKLLSSNQPKDDDPATDEPKDGPALDTSTSQVEPDEQPETGDDKAGPLDAFGDEPEQSKPGPVTFDFSVEPESPTSLKLHVLADYIVKVTGCNAPLSEQLVIDLCRQCGVVDSLKRLSMENYNRLCQWFTENNDVIRAAVVKSGHKPKT